MPTFRLDVWRRQPQNYSTSLVSLSIGHRFIPNRPSCNQKSIGTRLNQGRRTIELILNSFAKKRFSSASTACSAQIPLPVEPTFLTSTVPHFRGHIRRGSACLFRSSLYKTRKCMSFSLFDEAPAEDVHRGSRLLSLLANHVIPPPRYVAVGLPRASAYGRSPCRFPDQEPCRPWNRACMA
jgi:hypothetical protein